MMKNYGTLLGHHVGLGKICVLKDTGNIYTVYMEQTLANNLISLYNFIACFPAAMFRECLMLSSHKKSI